MLEIEIPGREPLRLTHLLLDYNGTLAVDGQLLPGVARRLESLAGPLTIRVVTADTFGAAAARTEALPVGLEILEPGRQDERKAALVRTLGPACVAAVGNGLNDRLMLETAALGIAIVQGEGAAAATLAAADVVVPDIAAALDLLLHPKRLVATLRV
jgi:soluble P-type ATPase